MWSLGTYQTLEATKSPDYTDPCNQDGIYSLSPDQQAALEAKMAPPAIEDVFSSQSEMETDT